MQGVSLSIKGRFESLSEMLPSKKIRHLLKRLFPFVYENFFAKKEVVHLKKRCNLCLVEGNFERQCGRKDICMVAEFGQRYHSLLHPGDQPKTDKEYANYPETKEQLKM